MPNGLFKAIAAPRAAPWCISILLSLLPACATLPPPAPTAAESPPAAPIAATESQPPTIVEAPIATPAAPVDTALRSGDVLKRFARASRSQCTQRNATADAAPLTTAYLSRLLSAALPMFEFVLGEVEARDLVGEFALIPLLESGFRADPGNRGAYRGLWQFSSATARAWGISVNARIDERLSPIASTRSALDHLAQMHSDFGDWRLAVLGYNAGAHAVRQSMRRGQPNQDGLPRGVSAHSLRYLRRLEGVACILAEPQRFGFQLPDQVVDPIGPIAVPSEKQGTAILAAATGIDPRALRALNPLLATAPSGHPALAELMLPKATHARLAAFVPTGSVARATATPAGVGEHRVVRGDNLWSIARRYGIPLDALRAWNRLGPSAVIRPGQRLRLAP